MGATPKSIDYIQFNSHFPHRFRANAASFIQQVHRTRRPVVITHRGKSAAELMDVAEYGSLMELLDLLQALQCGERQVDDGQGILHDEALSRILGRIAQ